MAAAKLSRGIKRYIPSGLGTPQEPAGRSGNTLFSRQRDQILSAQQILDAWIV